MKSPALGVALATLILGLLASPAGAIPQVRLAWDSCTGPVSRSIQPGDVASLYVSVVGHDQSHRGYGIAFNVRSRSQLLVDAWRFDQAGCQGAAGLTLDHLAPPADAASCPSFQGALGSQQIKQYNYDSLTGYGVTTLFVAYLGTNTTQVDPAQRYFLGRWRFDHASSVHGAGVPDQSCGGLEVGACLGSVAGSTAGASWLGANSSIHSWMFDNDTVTVGTGFECLAAVPAVNSTWGAIKNQYR